MSDATLPAILTPNCSVTVSRSPAQDPYWVFLARLAVGSRPAMRDALATIARIASGGQIGPEAFPWHQLRYQHTQAIRQRFVEMVSERTSKPLSPASVNKALAALRGVLREAWRLGLLSAEDLARATDLQPVHGSRPLRGRALEPNEVAALFCCCMGDSSPAGSRDAVVLALGLAAGLRRAEIASLDLSDVKLDREVVRVHGKGNKVREVPIKGGTLEAIRAWLGHRGSEPGPLLCPVNKSARVVLKQLAPQAILRVCEKRGREAGLAGFVAHDLRRTYISALLDRGVDLSLASELAGHTSPNTTKKYDRRSERAKHAAAATLLVPYGEQDLFNKR